MGNRFLSLWTALQVKGFEKAYDEFIAYITTPENWMKYIFIIIKILIIWIVAKIIRKVANRTLTHVIEQKERVPLRINRRRSRTIGKLVESVITYVVNFVAILMILSQVGFNLGPLLAGAGVLGLAIGFGAQSLVKDVITGFFIIFEDQFAVGDVVQTGNFKGTVESIGLRITTLRTWTGEVHMIPNGQILSVTNYSVLNSLGVIDLTFANDENLEPTMEVLRSILKNVKETNENVVSDPQLLGIQALGETTVTLRISVECIPNTQTAVIRQMNEEIRRKLSDPELKIVQPKAVNYSPGEKG